MGRKNRTIRNPYHYGQSRTAKKRRAAGSNTDAGSRLDLDRILTGPPAPPPPTALDVDDTADDDEAAA
jgi:hypothetical protein